MIKQKLTVTITKMISITRITLGWLYSAIHVGSGWKIQDRIQITDTSETKHKPRKSKQCKTKLPGLL